MSQKLNEHLKNAEGGTLPCENWSLEGAAWMRRPRAGAAILGLTILATSISVSMAVPWNSLSCLSHQNVYNMPTVATKHPPSHANKALGSCQSLFRPLKQRRATELHGHSGRTPVDRAAADLPQQFGSADPATGVPRGVGTAGWRLLEVVLLTIALFSFTLW